VSTEEKSRPPWAPLAAVALITVYAVLFVILNTHHTKVSFVFFSTRVSVIWVILLSLAAGLVLGVLLPRLNRRRHGGR